MQTTNAKFEPTIESVRAASVRIHDHIVHTQLLRSEELDRRLSAKILLKPEVLQTTGSFKFRGAMNRVLQFTEAQRKSGIVAWSSGNHALAISYVAGRLGVKATVLMPQEAPRTKIEGVKRNGGIVRLYDKTKETREEIGAQISAETGAVIVPPYDDPDIISGQGTVGLEIVEQARELGLEIDAALLSCSGGGLVSGGAIGIRGVSDATHVYCVEPEGFDDMTLSLAAGRRLTNASGKQSICDALLVPSPGELTFSINRKLLAGGLVVSDAEVIEAIRFAYQHLKLVVEPGGAAPLAAILSGKLDVTGKTVALVLSGGNVDPDKFASYIA